MKNLAIEDFIENGHYSYEAEFQIWKKDIRVFINFQNINNINNINKNNKNHKDNNINKDNKNHKDNNINNINKIGENYLKLSLSSIQEELEGIDENKSKIFDVFMDNNCLELAENWASTSPLLYCADDECYVMEDGKKVFLPITKENFYNSLYINTVSINFKKDIMDSLEITLSCGPDYFAGNYFVLNVTINDNSKNNKNIEFKGLSE